MFARAISVTTLIVALLDSHRRRLAPYIDCLREIFRDYILTVGWEVIVLTERNSGSNYTLIAKLRTKYFHSCVPNEIKRLSPATIVRFLISATILMGY